MPTPLGFFIYMEFTEFKQLVLEKAKNSSLNKDALIRLRTELFHAEVYYKDIGDLYEDLKTKPISNKAGVIPFILGFTKELNIEEPLTFTQVKPGASGGIDVDSDFSGEGRDLVIKYLKGKYGDDCVTPVGTTSTLQMKVACKDLLRYATATVAEANEFTKELDDELSFEENIAKLLNSDSPAKETYIKYQKVLDLVPRFLGKARNIGCHAGGVVLTPKPIWNYCPVELSSETIVTAFPESGSNQYLDEMGLVKLDLLAISVLDVIKETIELIDEKLYLIEDDDGLQKIVPASYLRGRIDEIQHND